MMVKSQNIYRKYNRSWTPLERVLHYMEIDPETGCWITLLPRNKGGYGHMHVKRPDGKWSSAGAHRIAYEGMVAPIPDGLTIDHLCLNPGCVNPDHLDVVTRSENTSRARKTHPNRKGVWVLPQFCRNGHEYTDETIYYDPRRPSIDCKICRRDNLRKSRARRRAAANPEF